MFTGLASYTPELTRGVQGQSWPCGKFQALHQLDSDYIDFHGEL